MCLIIVQQPHSPPLKRTVFENTFHNNPDGIGVLWVEDGQLQVFKTLDLQEFLYQYANVIPQDTPRVIHFRAVSVGEKKLENCHPFIYETKRKDGSPLQWGIVHNGTIKGFGDSSITDSEEFAKMYLSQLPNDWYGQLKYIHRVSGIIGTSKLVLLTGRNMPIIFNESYGHYNKDLQCWMSNYSYAYRYDKYDNKELPEDTIFGVDRYATYLYQQLQKK